MQYHKRLFIPAGRMPTHAVSGLQPYGPVSLPKNPYVLKSLHFESLHGEKLDARDRQIGPSGQVAMVPGGLKVHFRMDGRKPGGRTPFRLLNAKHFLRLPPKSVARQ